MANIKSSMKSIRQSAKKNIRNRSAKSRMRTFIKNVVQATTSGDLAQAQEAMSNATSVLAVTARKGIIHPNTAARQTSRLHARVKAMSIPHASAPLSS